METGRYKIEYKPGLIEETKKLPRKAQEWIERDINKKLTTAPFDYGESLRRNLHGFYKIRVAIYRIIYKIDEPRKIVTIFDIDYRRDIY